ncbi:hypothetical protein [Ferrovibrio sp.]|uniref:hypothetical protein n=1 Tax=Ferrovibrio sp. TaxID=1917215 RepID=UPI0025B7C14D|nr:hypothetical protein [Ferrovibrio sp.]MBX3454861.1 hypothetical protein [Ferrovibrio sp.]
MMLRIDRESFAEDAEEWVEYVSRSGDVVLILRDGSPCAALLQPEAPVIGRSGLSDRQ